MKYGIQITTGNDVLLDREIGSDDLVKVLLLVAGLGHDSVAAPDEIEEEEEPAAPRRKGAKIRKCSKCDKPGHTARTCEERQRLGLTPFRQDSGADPARPMHEILNEDQFDAIRHEVEFGQMNSREYAEENGFALREVNFAIQSRDYESYLDKRQTK